MKTNIARTGVHGLTHEGAQAAPMTAEQALRRSVMSCLLWENEFYEDGEEIATRIARLAGEVPLLTLADLAVEARERGKLRHVPLLLLSVLAKRWSSEKRGENLNPVSIVLTIAQVLQRADELSEFLTVHAKVQKAPPDKIKKIMSAAIKKGIALAFPKFDEYQLAKYDRHGAVRLRDALFLSHARPVDEEQAALWKRLVEGKLATPDTWEVALSGGADKREAFTRLLSERKLGYLALLRNLRNMAEAGVETTLVRDAILARKGAHRVLPFRYVAAARAAPQFEPYLDQALCEAVAEQPAFEGKTLVLADVSSSMSMRLSGKGDLTRMDAACILASIIHGDLRMFSFSDDLVEVPPRRGMAGVDALMKSQTHNGTQLIRAVMEVQRRLPHDRLIVITDEQSHPVGYRLAGGGGMPDPLKGSRGYMINVASAQRGIGYGRWTHIDGFSENVLRFMHEMERPGSTASPRLDPAEEVEAE